MGTNKLSGKPDGLLGGGGGWWGGGARGVLSCDG